MISTSKEPPIIIIGTGLAGYNLAKEIRKINPERSLVLITQDDGHFYSKPQLSIAISQAKAPQQLIISTVDVMRKQLNAMILTHTTVTAIDPSLQKIMAQTPRGSEELAYSQLVLAIGAHPKPFPLLNDINHLYRINNLLDYKAFREALPHFKHLTIIGSGLVGCEFAHDLATPTLDLHIKVITPDPYPLHSLVPSPVGEALQQALTSKGIDWHTQSNLSCGKNSKEIANTDGILLAIGLQANLSLATKAALSSEQGIVVNEFLQTSDPHIFALGDCAQIHGKCRQYVAPLLQCTRALAQTLCQKPTNVIFPLLPISLKISTYPIIILPPPRMDPNSYEIEMDGNSFKALSYHPSGNLQGYVLTGAYLDQRQVLLQEASRQSCLSLLV